MSLSSQSDAETCLKSSEEGWIEFEGGALLEKVAECFAAEECEGDADEGEDAGFVG